jgi:hypothetical protein
MNEEKEPSPRDSIFSAGKGDERRALNKIEIVSIRILERWDETINIMQLLKENLSQNTSRVERLSAKMKASLYAIFLMNDNLFQRRLKKNIYDEIKDIVCSNQPKSHEDLEHCFFIINTTFDKMGLTRVDLDFEKKTLEQINKAKGFD